MSASGITTKWFFAPPSACTRLFAWVPPRYTASATGVEPTKLTASIPGCARIASTVARPPCTTWNTPAGSPASASSSARIRLAEGSFSEGLRIKQFPVASATGIIHSGTIAGKLNGVMPATTPSGWRTDQPSIPLAIASVYSPFSRCGMPQANSTTSSPRWISPSASLSTLPCSAVIAAARRLLACSSNSLNLNITRARRSGGVAAQAGQAAAACTTAASISAAPPMATWPDTSPVAGLNTGAVAPPPAACAPFR